MVVYKLKKEFLIKLLFFQNRSIYYKSQIYIELKNDGKKKFDEKGVGYAEVEYFLNLALNELLECQKAIKKLGKKFFN